MTDLEKLNKYRFESLYEYLGHAAGCELGLEVHKASKSRNVFYKHKNVKTSTYNGAVKLYPVWFLKEFFSNYNKEIKTPTIKEKQTIQLTRDEVASQREYLSYYEQ